MHWAIKAEEAASGLSSNYEQIITDDGSTAGFTLNMIASYNSSTKVVTVTGSLQIPADFSSNDEPVLFGHLGPVGGVVLKPWSGGEVSFVANHRVASSALSSVMLIIRPSTTEGYIRAGLKTLNAAGDSLNVESGTHYFSGSYRVDV